MDEGGGEREFEMNESTTVVFCTYPRLRSSCSLPSPPSLRNNRGFIGYISYARIFLSHTVFPAENQNLPTLRALFLHSLEGYRHPDVSKVGMHSPKLDEMFHAVDDLLFGPCGPGGTEWVELFNKQLGECWCLNSRQARVWQDQLQELLLRRELRSLDKIVTDGFPSKAHDPSKFTPVGGFASSKPSTILRPEAIPKAVEGREYLRNWYVASFEGVTPMTIYGGIDFTEFELVPWTRDQISNDPSLQRYLETTARATHLRARIDFGVNKRDANACFIRQEDNCVVRLCLVFEIGEKLYWLLQLFEDTVRDSPCSSPMTGFCCDSCKMMHQAPGNRTVQLTATFVVEEAARTKIVRSADVLPNRQHPGVFYDTLFFRFLHGELGSFEEGWLDRLASALGTTVDEVTREVQRASCSCAPTLDGRREAAKEVLRQITVAGQEYNFSNQSSLVEMLAKACCCRKAQILQELKTGLIPTAPVEDGGAAAAKEKKKKGSNPIQQAITRAPHLLQQRMRDDG